MVDIVVHPTLPRSIRVQLWSRPMGAQFLVDPGQNVVAQSSNRTQIWPTPAKKAHRNRADPAEVASTTRFGGRFQGRPGGPGSVEFGPTSGECSRTPGSPWPSWLPGHTPGRGVSSGGRGVAEGAELAEAELAGLGEHRGGRPTRHSWPAAVGDWRCGALTHKGKRVQVHAHTH